MKKKSKVTIVLAVLLVSVAVLTAISTIFFKLSSENVDIPANDKKWDENIYKSRTQYIGDNSKVSSIVRCLNFPEYLKYMGIEISADNSDVNTLKIIFTQTASDEGEAQKKLKSIFSYNSMILFSLVENMDQVELNLNQNGETYKLEARQRDWAKDLVKKDPYEMTETLDEFRNFVKNIDNMDFENVMVPTSNVEDSISNAIMDYNRDKLYPGEFATQAHITYSTEKEDEKLKAYIYQNYSQFEFQNGIFELCSSVASPAAITFTKDRYGNLKMFSYEEPKDGAYYQISLQEIFPDDVIDKINAFNSNEQAKQTIDNQLLTSARQYLQDIGREDAKISLHYVEKNYPPLSQKNSETYDILYKAYSEFPYFVGSLEKIENHVRYEYKTDYEKQKDADIFTYTKTNMNTSSVEQKYKIKIENGNVTMLEGELRDQFKKYKEEYEKNKQISEPFKQH